MPIPNEILAVERPKNTRVKAGPKGAYYVIARTCIYKNGRNVPKELGVVGRIIDGKYVPNISLIYTYSTTAKEPIACHPFQTILGVDQQMRRKSVCFILR